MAIVHLIGIRNCAVFTWVNEEHTVSVLSVFLRVLCLKSCEQSQLKMLNTEDTEENREHGEVAAGAKDGCRRPRLVLALGNPARLRWRPVSIIFVLGLCLMIVAPLLRRYNKASPALAVGAFEVLAFSAIGLLHVDPRIGEAAIEQNRKEYLFFLACELPVFLLALISWKRFNWAFWLGWGINVAVGLLVLWVLVELTFFWHW